MSLDWKWKILRLLGEGGNGAVYEAEHLGNGRRVAIKVMTSGVDNPNARAYFFREGRLGNQVDAAARTKPVATGPGAVPVYDDGVTKAGLPYMVMEKLEGKPLDSLLKQYGRIEPLTTANILEDVLDVLDGAHKQGIVHRDLKPANLFLTPAGDVRVLDFGLAQTKSDREEPGYFIGTPGFAPPEQTIGLPSDARSDTWAAGATGYAMLTGQLPMRESLKAGAKYLRSMSPSEAKRVMRGETRPDFSNYPGCPVTSVRTYNPNVPRPLADVIDRSLSCNPERRYPSAKAMRDDIEAAIQLELAKTHQLP